MTFEMQGKRLLLLLLSYVVHCHTVNSCMPCAAIAKLAVRVSMKADRKRRTIAGNVALCHPPVESSLLREGLPKRQV